MWICEWLHQQNFGCVTHIKKPNENKRDDLNIEITLEQSRAHVLRLGFKGNRNECLRQCNVQYSRIFLQWRFYSWINCDCSLCQESLLQTLIITLITHLVTQQTKYINRHLTVRLTTTTDSCTHMWGCKMWLDHFKICPQHTEYFPTSGHDDLSSTNKKYTESLL